MPFLAPGNLVRCSRALIALAMVVLVTPGNAVEPWSDEAFATRYAEVQALPASELATAIQARPPADVHLAALLQQALRRRYYQEDPTWLPIAAIRGAADDLLTAYPAEPRVAFIVSLVPDANGGLDHARALDAVYWHHPEIGGTGDDLIEHRYAEIAATMLLALPDLTTHDGPWSPAIALGSDPDAPPTQRDLAAWYAIVREHARSARRSDPAWREHLTAIEARLPEDLPRLSRREAWDHVHRIHVAYLRWTQRARPGTDQS